MPLFILIPYLFIAHMIKLNKVLLFIFTLTVLIIAGEAIYLYTISKYAIKKEEKALFIKTTDQSEDKYKAMKEMEPAIHPKMIERLKGYVKSSESRLYILSEQTAKVLDIAKDGASVEDRREGKVYPGKIYFPYAIKLANQAMPDGFIWMYFHDGVIKRTNVWTKTQDGKQQKAELKDIKIGDTITTIEKWDPSVEPNMNRLQETLEKQVVDYNIYIKR